MDHTISKKLKRYNFLRGELEAVYHRMSLKLGLSDSASMILYAICEEGDSRLLSEICHLSGLSKQTVNSSIRKLEAEGILYLEKTDSKSKKVFLTEAGKSLAQRTVLKIHRAENTILASWPLQDVEKYLELTERLLGALKEEALRIGEET